MFWKIGAPSTNSDIKLSRKPAARLGEVIFANKVSLGGLGAERPETDKNEEIRW